MIARAPRLSVPPEALPTTFPPAPKCLHFWDPLVSTNRLTRKVTAIHRSAILDSQESQFLCSENHDGDYGKLIYEDQIDVYHHRYAMPRPGKRNLKVAAQHVPP